ncbi:hypothetical protein L596_019002 [Steinernema carpocapsae]|uniref:Neurotransmitter-gated ion-channel ligand-binding domain-containing protein n=1 Tax=Steinernema carpocapsae TaxID=34508 RepID=A0A4U5N6B4_STECR|nr:hypothetical protein L596_019002 [Steinernema carpocapsae]
MRLDDNVSASSGRQTSRLEGFSRRWNSNEVDARSPVFMLVVLLLIAWPLKADTQVELPSAPDRSLYDDTELSYFGVNDEQRLFRHIIRDYDVSVRPVYNASTVVNIFMGLTLTHIFNIDERNQVLALNVWVEQSWRDERITWDPEGYGNISKLTLPTQYVWTPDIVLYNNARDFSRGFVDTNLHILNTGDMQWAPPAKIYSICKLDVTYFPFDDQFCILEFGSWIYDRSQLDVQIVERFDGKAPFTKDSFTENGEWEIVSNRTRKVLRGRQSVYPTIVFEMHLRRRVLYFMYNIVAPCAMLSILTMMQFMLPCESGEKVTLGLTVLLAYSVFSFNIAENMPETSEVIPLIAIYLMSIMGISGMSVCLSVIVLNMRHGAEHKCNIPKWLHYVGFRILGKVFGIGENKIKRTITLRRDATRDLLSQSLVSVLYGDPSKGVIFQVDRVEADQQFDQLMQHWSQLSNIFDRFFFCCIFLMTTTSTVLLLILCPRFSERNFELL